MNKSEIVRDDRISLVDLWEMLREGRLAVVSGVVLGIAGAALAIFLISPKYEAVAVVRVGQVGQVDQFKVTGQPVEPPVQAIERMKTPAFQRRVAEALGDQEWLNALARSGATKDLSLQVIKATLGAEQTPLIELRVRGESPEAARKKAGAAIDELIGIHDELAQPALSRMRTDLAIAHEKLIRAEHDLDELKKLVAATGIKNDRFIQLALMTSLITQKEAEVFSQRQIVMALETALEAPATQGPKAIEEVFTTDKPVSPKKSLLLAVGTIGGLLAGVLWVFGADSWRRARAFRQSR